MATRAIVHGGIRRRFIGVVSICAVLLLATWFAAPAPASAPAPALSGEAPDGPGATSYLDMARKDCFGTARNTRSKVWFTVADGVLSDVFSPTIENTNVSTVQYVVTDGRTFTALQQRDMTYAVSSPDRSGMVCRVTSTDRAHHFRLISDYLTDPARDSVVIHTRLVPIGDDARSVRSLKLYVRYDATIDNTGGGGKVNGGPNNATIDPATTALVSSDTKAPKGPFSATVVGALLADHPFLAESSGFVGSSSDGLSQLDTHHLLVTRYRSATDGNVAQTARVDMTPGRPFTLALGFAPNARSPEAAPLSLLGGHSAGTSRAGAATTPTCAARRGTSPGSPRARTPRWTGPTGCRPT
jgi:glucoamylase